MEKRYKARDAFHAPPIVCMCLLYIKAGVLQDVFSPVTKDFTNQK